MVRGSAKSNFRMDGVRSIAPRRAMLCAPEIIFGNRYSAWTTLLLMLLAVAGAGCIHEKARRDPAIVAEARAVEFLKREVPAWSRENGCFSCHNNGDAARALYAASRKGRRVPDHVLADTTEWVKRPARWDDNKGDPGFSDKRLADIQFAAS